MIKKIAFSAFVMVVCLTCSAYSAVVYNQWTGGAGTSNWNTAGNWNLGYVPHILAPDGINNVKAGSKSATGPVLVAGDNADAYQFTLGGPGGGILTFNGGTLMLAQYITMGASVGDNGTLVMNSGTFNINTTFFVGQLGQGTVNMTGGDVNAVGNLTIADTAGATGTVNLNGGTIRAASLLMNRSGGATAKMDIGGGTLILNGDQTTAIDGFVSGGLLVAYGGSGTVMRDYNITNSGKTTVWGYFADPNATSPSPANGAINVAVTATLSWTAGGGAASHNVYFGTTSPGTSQGNQTVTTFNPGTLSYGTTYYWRIDEVNEANVVTTGNIWSFTTTTGQATNPSPANGATNVSLNPTLSWTAGQGAASHNVYFGTTSPGTFQGNQGGTTFNPGTLTANITYYWRIDEVIDSNTVITGTVWSFTAAQLKATNPSPGNGATGVSLNATLSWTAGAGAVSHDVYFGKTSPGAFQGNQPGTSFNPGILDANTTYYWRIDEKDGNTTTGDVWNFTTGTPPEVYPYLSWRNDPKNSIVVNWYNSLVTGDSSVDYGLTNSYGSTVNVPTVTNYHHVELTGLTPGMTYHYRIRSTDGTVGSDNTFTTAAANITSFNFAVYGDPRSTNGSNQYYARHQALCNWILAQNYDFAIETGDTVWAGQDAPPTNTALTVYWPDFFRLESNLSKSKVIMATMGNHEVQDAGASTNYMNFYSLAFPTYGTSGNDGRVYSFNYGNAHFVCLSSYQMNLNQQATWLEADLIAARANPNIKWIFAFMHAPMYTTNTTHTNRTDCIAAWGPLFDTYHVDMVFAGHNHLYERSKSIKAGAVVDDGEGTVYVTNGLGGAEFNPPGSGSPGLFVTTYTDNTLATCITINGNYLTVTSITNANGAVIDSFQLNKTLPGDFNQDGTVDMKDLSIFCGSWLDTGIWP
ncbi:MAG: metallophosphoesterase [Sedimentisphaerales bacterium]